MAETYMASDKDVWVVLELDTLTVYKSSDDGKQLTMPVSGNGYRWGVMSMSLPFLVQVVQVFKVPTDKDIGTDPSLLKSINIEGDEFVRPFYSTLVVGVLHSSETSLHVFEKAKLLDASVLPENVERRELELGADGWLSRMNTTSLVYIKNHYQGGQLHHQSLVKRDFWMSNSKSE